MGRDGSVGTATRYGLDSPGIESQWPSGLRRGSAAARFLRLRVRTPPRTWMFVLCKDKRQNPEQSRQRITDTVQRENKKNPCGGEIFRTRLDPSQGPFSLLHNGYRVSFPGVKQQGRGFNHPPPSSAEVKETIELYLYPTSGPSWPV